MVRALDGLRNAHACLGPRKPHAPHHARNTNTPATGLVTPMPPCAAVARTVVATGNRCTEGMTMLVLWLTTWPDDRADGRGKTEENCLSNGDKLTPSRGTNLEPTAVNAPTMGWER